MTTTQTALPRRRADLVIAPDGASGRGFVVKDPRSRRFFRFGELEGRILAKLDGTKSALDLQVELAAEMGESLALDEVDAFIDQLVEQGLAENEASPLPAFRPELGRQVLAALEQGGFDCKPARALGPGVDPRTPQAAEALKLQEALTLLRAGRFRAALVALDEIIAANPKNERAHALRALLVQAGERHRASGGDEAAQKKEKRNLLYLRLPLFNPDRLFDLLAPLGRLVFSPGFAGLYAALLALAALVALLGSARLGAALAGLSVGQFAAGFLVAAVIQTAFHELAHGMACKRRGGRVPELGFLLILFFLPALYVDVSDAWLFRRKRDRLMVSLAGPLFDLGVAALAILVWWASPPGVLSGIAVIVAAASTASVLLNLNPLIRLDGYYTLSDWCGLPNLREIASASFARGLGRLMGKAPRRSEAESLTPRARRFVLLYGVLSTLYIAFIFSILGRIVLSWASDVAGAVGPIVIVALLAWLLRRPLLMLARGLVGALAGRRLVRLAFVAALLAGVAFMPWSLRVSGPATLDAAQRVALRPEQGGVLAALLVEEGEVVEQGQLVAKLDESEARTRLDAARSDLRRAEASLARVIRGAEREDLRQASERVAALRVEAEQLRSRHGRLSRLLSEGLVAADMHEQVDAELRVKEGMLRSAIEEERRVKRGAAPEEIEAARADVARQRAELEEAERRLARCELFAPASGTVVTPDLDARLGERIPAGALVLELAATEELIAEIDVLESEIGDVRLGSPVRLVLSAYPTRSFSGEVLEISPAASLDELGRAVFRVKASVSVDAGLLRPGMTGAAKIEAGRRPIGTLIARRVVRLIDPSLL